MNIVESGSPRIAFGSYNVYGQKMRSAGNAQRGKDSGQSQADLALEEFNRQQASGNIFV